MPTTLEVWNHIQRQLFPMLREELGTLTDKDSQFVEVMGVLPLGLFLEPYGWAGTGCSPHERAWLVHAFIAKAVYEFPTTRALIEALQARPALRRLCGWESLGDLPHESTFSRAFAAFAEDELPQKIHAALVCRQRGDQLVGHVSRDSSAIDGCEKPAPRPPAAPKVPARRGRPARGQERPRLLRNGWTSSPGAPWPRIWPTCPPPARWVASATARAIKSVGLYVQLNSAYPWRELFRHCHRRLLALGSASG